MYNVHIYINVNRVTLIKGNKIIATNLNLKLTKGYKFSFWKKML